MTADPATVVYVSNAGSREIVVFAMDRDSGALVPIERTAGPGTDEPSPTSMPLAIGPAHRFLYAALRRAPFPGIELAIDPRSGRLSLPKIRDRRPAGPRSRAQRWRGAAPAACASDRDAAMPQRAAAIGTA